jgi:membrane associated rhomboid family serine protease
MLPLKDRNPTTRPAILTVAFIAANVALFLLWQPTLLNKGPTDDKPTNEAIFFYCHGLVPWELTHLKPLGEGGRDAVEVLAKQFDSDAGLVHRLIVRECPHKNVLASVLTSMFMHGGWLHIGGNMLFLWVFGNNVEDKAGYAKYLIFYLFCGVAATAAHVLFSPSSAVPTVGASGAIAGVLGAYLVMFPRRRVLTLVIFIFITTMELPAVALLGFWFVLQLLPALQSVGGAGAGVTGVAVWAHVGGFVAGALIALAMFPKERGDPYAVESGLPPY